MKTKQSPQEWKTKTLGEVGKIFNGNSINAKVKKEKYFNIKDGIPYIATKDISYANNINYENGIKIPEKELKDFRVAHKNSVFICAEGGSAGRKLAFNMMDVCFVNKLFAIETLDFVDSKFVYYFYQATEFQKQFKSQMTGLIGGVSLNKFKQIQIPLPPLQTQKQIVKILDDAFESISKSKENAEKNLKNAKELFESYLEEIFSNPKEDWEERKLGENDLIEIIDGDRGKNYPTQKDFLDKGYCLFMNTKNVRPNGFKFNVTMFINEAKDKAMGKGKLKRNDVVMTTRGTIGNLGVFNNNVEYENIRINSGMLIFRPNLKQIIPEYLFEILRSRIVKEQIKKQVSGAAQPQLPIKTLVNFIIPVPKSINQQTQIVSKLDSLSKEIKELESIYKQKVKSLDELKKSILQKAFAGELTK